MKCWSFDVVLLKGMSYIQVFDKEVVAVLIISITTTACPSPALGIVLVAEIPLINVSYLVWEIMMAE